MSAYRYKMFLAAFTDSFGI